MDPKSIERLGFVMPELSTAIQEIYAEMLAQGIPIRVGQGLRTASEQDALEAQGRTTPGVRVTNAKAGYSMHNFGLAVDCFVPIRGKTPWTMNENGAHPDYEILSKAGVAHGLVSGLNWVTRPDAPHLQMDGCPVTPTDQMRRHLASGLSLVWQSLREGVYKVSN